MSFLRDRRVPRIVGLWLLFGAAWAVGCYPGGKVPDPTTSTTTSGMGGMGGGTSNPCGVDCSGFQTGPCQVAVCNTGQVPNNPMNTCVVVSAEDGTSCDDGKYCTVSDYCDKGVCMGGTQNECGLQHDACTSVICYEDSKTCSTTPVNDGSACAPTNLCQVSGICTQGTCVGVPKDCSSSPMAECNQVTCDTSTGACVGTADSNKNGTPCMLSGDLCTVDKTCMNGMCVGTMPKDCSLLDIQCQIGVCDPMSGVCKPSYAPAGMSCTNGLQECQLGTCNTTGTCVPQTAPDGSGCNDHDSCTQTDTCHAGVCSGASVAGCSLYLNEGFEGTCPDNWTLTGDWECGTPMGMSPVTPFDGHGVIATQLDGLYHNGETYAGCTATSPAIDLSAATSPMVSFWAWVWTDAGDGFNVQASTNGGTTFLPVVMGVRPSYTGMVAGELAWSGALWQAGWQNYTADLSGFKSSSTLLRFAFESDTSGVEPGVYIDDVVVAEPVQIPLYITTTSPLPDAYVGKEYSATITKVGGTSMSSWTKVLGVGTNNGWFVVNPGTIPGTAVITGLPTVAAPVSFTLQVMEPGLPSNIDEQTFTFDVKPDLYYTSWENVPCANGWTLTGDWKCGVPMNVGPANASDGAQCIGTGMGQDYSNGDTWATTTATSPPISLANSLSPSLTFQMWVDTDGASDGLNLQILEQGMTMWTVVQTVTPPYGPTIAGDPAWAGDQTASGWQLVQADLTMWAGKTVQLRFAFQSSASSPTLPGVYIDDLLVQ